MTGTSDHFARLRAQLPATSHRAVLVQADILSAEWPWSSKKVAHKTTWDDAVCIDVCMLPGGEGERRVVERGAEEGRCWADSKVHPYWCLVAAGGPGQWLTKQTWDDAVCIDVCMLP